MNILILGVNGFIGNALTRRILDTTDWEVFGLDMSSDKLEHFAVYALVMLWFAQIYARNRTRWAIALALVGAARAQFDAPGPGFYARCAFLGREFER